MTEETVRAELDKMKEEFDNRFREIEDKVELLSKAEEAPMPEAPEVVEEVVETPESMAATLVSSAPKSKWMPKDGEEGKKEMT
jgi:sugar-specific transcriptional regulator TrmB